MSLKKKRSSKSLASGPLHQPKPAGSESLTAFCPEFGVKGCVCCYYAHLAQGTDAHTLRIFDTTSEICISRWASSSSDERVGALGWALLQSTEDAPENAPTRKNKRRRKSKTTEDEPAEVIPPSNERLVSRAAAVLGLQDGSILLLDPTNGVILAKLTAAASTSPILCLSCPTQASEPSIFWSASVDGTILVWKLPSSDGSGGSCIGKLSTTGTKISARYESSGQSVNTDDVDMQDASTNKKTRKVQLLIGRQEIQCVSLPIPAPSAHFQQLEPEVLCTATGHASEISTLSWLDSNSDAVTFMSTAKNDRFVSIWHAKDAPSTTEAQLVASVAAEDDVSTARVVKFNKASLLLVTILINGVITISQLTQLDLNPSTPKAKGKAGLNRLSVTSRISPARAAAPGFCDVQSASKGGQLRISRTGIKPAFYVTALQDENGPIASISIDTSAKAASNKATEDGDQDMATTDIRLRANHKNTAASAVPTADSDMENANATNPGEIDIDNEPSLADRLKSLKVARGEIQAPDEKKTSSTSLVPVPTGSLAQTLTQALHSSDSRLLESCLVHSKSKVVSATVKRLPVQLVLPLVEALVDRLGRNKRGYGAGVGGASAARGRAMVQWLRTVLVVHIAHLVTIPGLVTRLGTLYRTVEARLELHQPLLALNGRLELVVSQIDLRREALEAAKSKGPAIKKGKQVAAQTYVEGEDDSSSAEDAIDVEENAENDQDEGEIEDVIIKPGSRNESSDGSDSGDDSDDEDTPMNGSRSNGVHQFLDVEAEEDSDEDSDDSNGSIDGFIDDEIEADDVSGSDEEQSSESDRESD